MTHHTVIVVGAGPTGLMLAGELALAGVHATILERRANQSVLGARAGGLHARTLEILDQRGIAERFVSQGTKHPAVGFSGVSLDISDFPTRHNYVLALWQVHIERALAEWVASLGVTIRYGVEVSALTQRDDEVEVVLADGKTVRARYLVGCDGGRSRIRKSAGIAFPGTDPTTSNLIAEAEFAEEPPEWGLRRDAIGLHAITKGEDGRGVRVMITERSADATSEPTLADISAGMIAVYGTDYGIHSPTWISRFTDATRQAATYRDRRVFLAGDAAHVHPPDGGHGLQTGVQDAVNLGWKLAQVIRGISPDTLLDTYHAERHPVGARVLQNTRASVALRGGDAKTMALRETLAELLSVDGARRKFAALMSGLDVHYDFGTGHPLLGRRIPDLELRVGGERVRLYALLHDARPLFVDFGAPGAFSATRFPAHVRRVDAAYDGTWELPAIGVVAAPAAVLVRPDGYVAWTGEASDAALSAALVTWFGAAS